MAAEARDNPDKSRYELVDDGEVVGIADYYVDGETMVFPHVEIVSYRRGNGLGEFLVRRALDDARQRGFRIDPQCPFVRDFVQANPEYAA